MAYSLFMVLSNRVVHLLILILSSIMAYSPLYGTLLNYGLLSVVGALFDLGLLPHLGTLLIFGSLPVRGSISNHGFLIRLRNWFFF
jgi:hypothetical protein